MTDDPPGSRSLRAGVRAGRCPALRRAALPAEAAGCRISASQAWIMAASSRDLMSTGSPSPFPWHGLAPRWRRAGPRRNARLNALSLDRAVGPIAGINTGIQTPQSGAAALDMNFTPVARLDRCPAQPRSFPATMSIDRWRSICSLTSRRMPLRTTARRAVILAVAQLDELPLSRIRPAFTEADISARQAGGVLRQLRQMRGQHARSACPGSIACHAACGCAAPSRAVARHGQGDGGNERGAGVQRLSEIKQADRAGADIDRVLP